MRNELGTLFKKSPGFIDEREIRAFRTELNEDCKELDYNMRLGKEANQLATQALHDPKDRHLFRIVPLICGTKVHKWLEQYHQLGLALSLASGAPLNIAHLYNAGKQCGELPEELHWLDVEKIIETQGESHMFVGNLPVTRKDIRA